MVEAVILTKHFIFNTSLTTVFKKFPLSYYAFKVWKKISEDKVGHYIKWQNFIVPRVLLQNLFRRLLCLRREVEEEPKLSIRLNSESQHLQKNHSLRLLSAFVDFFMSIEGEKVKMLVGKCEKAHNETESLKTESFNFNFNYKLVCRLFIRWDWKFSNSINVVLRKRNNRGEFT